MVIPAEFEQWCRALLLAPATCDLIASRRVARCDAVGATSSEEEPKRCSFSRAVDLYPARLTQVGITKLQCPECSAMWTARIRGTMVLFPPHPPRTTRVAQAISRWIKQGGAWKLSEYKR